MLKKLNKNGYEVFVKDIQRIGYEVRTSNRVKFFNPIYKIDENDFEIVAKARKINLKKELPKNLPEWKIDPDLTIQILTSLIDHALQFAKKEANNALWI